MYSTSSGVVIFDLGPLFQGHTRIATLKSVDNSLIIVPRVLGCETKLLVIMGWESSDKVRFDFWSLLKGHMRMATLKSAYNLFIIGPRSLQCQNNL